MACVLSSSLFTRVLVIICIVSGVMASEYVIKDYFYPENFTFDCDNYYVSETLQKRSCTIDFRLFQHYKCINHRFFRFIKNRDKDDQVCLLFPREDIAQCEKVQPSKHGDIQCKSSNQIVTYTCYFNTSEEYRGQQIDCIASCRVNISDTGYRYFSTNATCPLYAGVPTLEPPTTAAPTTTAAPPEKEFPIWAAVVIALGIGGLIALLLFLVWRKRRQAQRLAQDAEGGNAENPEGEEAEGGDNDAEEEEATNAESAEKSEDAEGGEEAPEEQ
ncbi:uncharacterized protein LOC112572533 [Pomacea canaliculata]|uniref:uncharacterized protein LOC112572533 n=1 Tax=Pomacea canaliculata TaxID=400727 RepID=UPI000D727E0E|nr:uncharacterized protein LOC112572533 [Pomacea canaliculata]